MTPDEKREYHRQATAKWRAANPERSREINQRAYAKRDPQADREKAAAYYWAHRDEIQLRRTSPEYRVAVREPTARRARQYAEDPAKRQRRRARQRRIYANDPESLRAKSRRRRALVLSAQVEPYRDADIFERDKWVCQLCHKKIDKRRKWPDQMSASIDHIVPLSLGGSDCPTNVHAAHLLCNSRKHVKAMGEQLRIIG